MLLHRLNQPEILAALARAGHGAKVLIADGNYPASSALGPAAVRVSLNLSPGRVTCPQVLEALVSAAPFEAAHVMAYATTGPQALREEPPVWADYRRILADAGLALRLEPIERFAFYESVRGPDHVLTIQTGEQQIYANLLLTVGVRRA